MTSSKPYLIRAIYEWLVDNRMTPYVMVDAMQPNVSVPERFVQDGKIILNIAPEAVNRLELKNDAITFEARFSGIIQVIYVPVKAVKAIYAYENGRGMVFEEDDDGDDGANGSEGEDVAPIKGKPHLKIVK